MAARQMSTCLDSCRPSLRRMTRLCIALRGFGTQQRSRARGSFSRGAMATLARYVTILHNNNNEAVNRTSQLGLKGKEGSLEPRCVKTLRGKRATGVACGSRHTAIITGTTPKPHLRHHQRLSGNHPFIVLINNNHSSFVQTDRHSGIVELGIQQVRTVGEQRRYQRGCTNPSTIELPPIAAVRARGVTALRQAMQR